MNGTRLPESMDLSGRYEASNGLATARMLSCTGFTLCPKEGDWEVLERMPRPVGFKILGAQPL